MILIFVFCHKSQIICGEEEKKETFGENLQSSTLLPAAERKSPTRLKQWLGFVLRGNGIIVIGSKPCSPFSASVTATPTSPVDWWRRCPSERAVETDLSLATQETLFRGLYRHTSA